MTSYDRDRFGQAWLDADRNGCDTRNDILAATMSAIEFKPGTHDCLVLSGRLEDRYTALTLEFVYGDGAIVDIDHLVALGNAWVTGAAGWDVNKRAALANDPLNLLPVDAGENRSKGDADAATWLPPSKSFRCDYVAAQIAVKAKYGLWVTSSEAEAMRRVLGGCPEQEVPRDSGAPTRVDQDLPDPGADEPAGLGGTKINSGPESGLGGAAGGEQGSVYYNNCDEARAASAAPLYAGEAGYALHLDGDADGDACE